MFKRRDKRGAGRVLLEAVYPPGGWARAVNYVWLRLRRLPDPPHRIARGVAAGAFVTFTPFFGLHFFLAAFVAWLVRGNIIAAIFATLIGNPLTFPFIAAGCMTVGNWLLDRHEHMQFHALTEAFKEAGGEVWWNIKTLFNAAAPHWDSVAQFYSDIFLPYMLGGGLLGGILAWSAYAAFHPFIDAYQRRRSRMLQQKLQARLKLRSRAVAE